MRKLYFLLIVIGSSMFISCDATQAEISLPTMMCSMCEQSISKTLMGIDGVKGVKVDFSNKTSQIAYDDKKISLKNIEEKISSIGYQANKLAADPLAYESLPRCCKVGM